MKRIIALLLALCLLLCGCGKKKDTDPSTEPSDSVTESGSSIQESVGGNTDVELPAAGYRNPLTGEKLETPWSGQISAVMINNLKKAMPQHGISQADIFYEIEVEGDITRCLAVFSDLTGVASIGPVRSVRTAFSSVAVSYDAPLIHCGGSTGTNLALGGHYGDSSDKIANWEHIDADSKHFFRDQDRLNNGVAWEHTLFTTGEKLQQALKAYGYDTPTDKSYGLNFSEDVALDGEKAEEVTVKFKSGKSTVLKYDAATKRYTLFMHGTEHIDGNTGKAVTFKNVIAIYTKQWYHADGTHKYYETIGKGEGYAAINGKIVPILWSRQSLRSPYIYTLKDGTPLNLEVGNTYVALVGIKNPIAYK